MEYMSSNTKYIDYLTEDDPIPSQMWVCISFLSPEGIKNCNVRGLKIRGCYPTREQADARAKHLQEIDPDYNVFVGEVGKWLPWDPDVNSVEDQQFQEKELNDLAKGYKKNLEKAKSAQEQRKRDMVNQAAKQEKSTLEQRKDRMRAKLEERRKNKEDVKELTEKEKEIEHKEKELEIKEKKVKEERRKLIEIEEEIEDKEEAVGNIDEKLSRIQELYAKINKKRAAQSDK